MSTSRGLQPSGALGGSKISSKDQFLKQAMDEKITRRRNQQKMVQGKAESGDNERFEKNFINEVKYEQKL